MTGPATDPAPVDPTPADIDGVELRAPAPLRPPPEADVLPDDPVGVGEVLRRTRAGRGLSLAEASQHTRINRAYLEALEAGRLELLPAPVYARGFLRSYARYLGLDGDAAAAVVAVAVAAGDLPRPVGLEPPPGMRRLEPRALTHIQPQLLAIGAAVLLVLAVAVLLLLRMSGGGAGEERTGDAAADERLTAPLSAPAAVSVPSFAPDTMPDFTGVSRETAEQLLGELEVAFVVIEARDEGTAAGRVFAQAPDPGAPLGPQDTVTLIVSRGGTPATGGE